VAGSGGAGSSEVREAGPADAESISAFLGAVWAHGGPDAPGLAGATADSIAAVRSLAALRSRMGQPGRRMFIAAVGPAVVGFAATTTIGRNHLELAGIAVLPAHTGHRIGSRLLELVASSARQDGFARLTVRTELTNDTALLFYDSRGFTPVGEQVQVINGSRIPVVVLTRHL
jgi:ribosomal protein S18 acetylase RimI-like enzyme